MCEGLDTAATIELNGVTIGTTNNMFRRYEFDIAETLQLSNTLSITFESAETYAAAQVGCVHIRFQQRFPRLLHIHTKCHLRTMLVKMVNLTGISLGRNSAAFHGIGDPASSHLAFGTGLSGYLANLTRQPIEIVAFSEAIVSDLTVAANPASDDLSSWTVTVCNLL